MHKPAPSIFTTLVPVAIVHLPVVSDVYATGSPDDAVVLTVNVPLSTKAGADGVMTIGAAMVCAALSTVKPCVTCAAAL